MQLILIRHGESVANRLSKKPEGFLCGRYDCDLTQEGLEKAKSLRGAKCFEDVDIYFCSPLKRTIQTIRTFTDEKYITDDRIMERTMGEFDGHTISELRDNPVYYEYFHGDKIQFRKSFSVTAPGGENYSDVEKRVGEFLNDLMKTDYKKAVIVSHFCTIRCMIKIINGLSEEDTLKLDVKQCEPIIINLFS